MNNILIVQLQTFWWKYFNHRVRNFSIADQFLIKQLRVWCIKYFHRKARSSLANQFSSKSSEFNNQNILAIELRAFWWKCFNHWTPSILMKIIWSSNSEHFEKTFFDHRSQAQAPNSLIKRFWSSTSEHFDENILIIELRAF